MALWLPPEYRAIYSSVKANKVALGHDSGRISFLEFHVQLYVSYNS